MKTLSVVTAVVALSAMTMVAHGEEKAVKSGLQPGKQIGPFYVVKCAGAEEDGVKVGKELCYRCKYGGRPQVMVFTRSSDKNVAKLVTALDSAIGKNAEKELKAFVNLLGEDKEALSATAKKFAKKNKVENVPVVVPNEFENGPENYGINPKADVTIIFAEGGKVKANHAVAAAKDLNVKAVVADIVKSISAEDE